MKLGALPYHKDVASYLRTGEAALWSWFESDQFSERHAGTVKLELLKSTYRLTRADQPDVYLHAGMAAEKLGLDLPVTVYQSHGGNGQANAALVFLPDEAALVLTGNIGDLLSEEEMLAVFGHELAHHRLYSIDGGRYFTAERLLDWCAA
jgi:Zn-dependent protease with chaperone function